MKNGFGYIWDGEHYNEYFTNREGTHYITIKEGDKEKRSNELYSFQEYLNDIGLPGLDQYASQRVGLTVFRKRWFRAGESGIPFPRYDIVRDVDITGDGVRGEYAYKKISAKGF